MIELSPPLRRAVPDDAAALAELVNMAGEGLPLCLWAGMAEPGQSPWAVGEQRARRDEGGVSWRKAVVVAPAGEVIAALVGYPLPAFPRPIPADLPALFRPLQELENLAPGTWYVNVLAVRPGQRRAGWGRRLMDVAARLAGAARCRAVSLVVADANAAARQLYEVCGYREAARRPMVKNGWSSDSRDWVLMRRWLVGRRDTAAQP